MIFATRLLPAFAALVLAGCAHSIPDDPSDPFEPVNRAVFRFNLAADQYLTKPVAKTYVRITPAVVQRGVSNFFANLDEPRNMVNALLQGKLTQTAKTTGRFVMNSTIGLAGVMDVASDVGLEREPEDFGQTLGRWGLGNGVYLMLPLLGPTTGRDFVGQVGDWPTTLTSVANEEQRNALLAAGIIETRARILPADSVLENAIDPYIFVRSAYLQSRLSRVYDGDVPAKLLYGDDVDDSPEDAPDTTITRP